MKKPQTHFWSSCWRLAIGVESYELRRTKKDHDLRFDTSTAPKAYRIASVWILRLRYDT
ncbi:hypothetical protein BT69DRAFT_1280309 [Atractiella rhizophila]|nr:hypothetical protein BT69DRAFT_1280309 [Atractiella rhizophila]